MKKINEIFYSIQGEGRFAGTPAVFIRFAGCNIKCPFCDTEHQKGIAMSDEEIIQEVKKYPTRLVVITGGEPTLQLDEQLCRGLQKADKYIAIETNGTREIPKGVNYVTYSPKFEFTKVSTDFRLTECDELKVVYNGENHMSLYDNIQAKYYYLQPCDVGDAERNAEIMQKTVQFCLQNPKWNISLQTQKILKIR